MECIDLFSGCGGFSKGAEAAGVKVLCGIDVWQTAVDTYNANFDHDGICADLTKTTPEEIAEKIQRTHVDLIIGGPPCQGYSMAGKRDPNDPRAVLFEEYMKFVVFFDPSYIIIENVPGILTMKDKEGGLVKDTILKRLDALGYAVKYEKLYAPDYGVPQKRRRVFFFGAKKELEKHMVFPPAKLLDSDHYVPVKDILFDRADVDAKYFHSQRMIDGFAKRREANKKNGKGFGAQILDPDQPSYTLFARYYKDGSDALVRYSDTEIRKLTEREAARIQSFPDDFLFKGSLCDIYKQIGNAVPVLLGKAVAKCVVDTDQAVRDGVLKGN